MSTNTIEHPTWAETEYENIKRREVRVSILSHLAVAFVIFGLIIFALATLRDVARHIRKRNAKPAPVVEARPLPPMYDLDRYFQSVGGREAECELIQVPCPDGLPGCTVLHCIPVKKAGQQ
jgi:hypothetical protein